MNDVKLNSRHNSDGMSPTRRQLPPLKRSERSFLDDQAADARSAMARTLQDMKDTLKGIADVRSGTKQHLWLVVGSAAAAGFVAGVVLTPAPRKNSEITGPSTEAVPPPSPPQNKKSLLFSTMATIAADFLQTIVKSLIAAFVVAQDQPQVETQSPRHATGEVESNG